MIGSLRGEVLERGLDGDGAARGRRRRLPRRRVTPRTLAELEPTTPAFLYVHHHIREDGQTLYGFATRDERATFQVLIATHGVGPALAMAILATHPPAALVDIVAGGDLGALTLVPGVGKKTAERLLVELKSRLSVPCSTRSARRRRGGSADRRRARGARRARLRRRRRSATRCASCRPTPTRRRCCATRSSCSGRAVRDEFLEPGVADDAEDAVEAGLRPRRLAEFVGQRELKEHLGDRARGGRAGAARPSTTCCSPGRPGSARPRWPASSPPRWACTLHVTSGPALERAGDLAAILTKLDERRRAVHRRDPPAVAGRRGDPLPGDGGLPARHRRRQGPGGVEHPPDAAAVHARRGDDAHRA